MEADYIVSDVYLSDVDEICEDEEGSVKGDEINDEVNQEEKEEEEDAYVPIRSANEREEEYEEVPESVDLDEKDKLESAGTVSHQVGKTVVIKNNGKGLGGRVLDLDTLIFTEEGKVIGRIYDTLGQVKDPYYAVYTGDMKEIEMGMGVYYVERYSNIVFEETIRKERKGCDASNEHDEEVDEAQIEYSDDEEERLNNFNRKKKRGWGVKEGIL